MADKRKNKPTDRETPDKQTDKPTDRETPDKQTDKPTDRMRWKGRHVSISTDRLKDRNSER